MEHGQETNIFKYILQLKQIINFPKAATMLNSIMKELNLKNGLNQNMIANYVKNQGKQDEYEIK